MRIVLSIISVMALSPSIGRCAEGTKGMVVCVSPLAADVGAQVLRKGGNAVDAAIAVGFAQAVTWPEAGNFGGGGFMLIRPANGRNPVVIDYREMAPAAATKDLFAKKLDYLHANTAGVPGTVRGFALAHKRFGKLKWNELVEPAAKLAEDGFVVNAALAKSLNTVLANSATTNAEFRKVYGKANGKEKWIAGDVLKLPDLARTLRMVATNGAEAFYTGEPAKLLVKEMQASGGLITLDDMKNYSAVERKAMVGTYRGHEIIGAPPPSSGGTTLMETLNILENFDVKKHPWNSAETIHLLAESTKRAYADRARYLGDPKFTKIPEHLTSKEHAKKLAVGIDLKRATPSAKIAPEIPLAPESNETTHYSIIDKEGMAVSNTYTLENSFGCRVVVRGAGFILNNEMTDFNPQPGITNTKGQIGTEPNQVAPGKRMLSSQCPTIVAKNGKVLLVTGSPGGRTIINTVLCVVVNVIDFDASAQVAVDAPRLHHQWFPDRIQMEDRPGFAALSKQLETLGHTVLKRKQGDAHTIWVNPKTGLRVGAADTRLDGKAIAE